ADHAQRTDAYPLRNPLVRRRAAHPRRRSCAGGAPAHRGGRHLPWLQGLPRGELLSQPGPRRGGPRLRGRLLRLHAQRRGPRRRGLLRAAPVRPADALAQRSRNPPGAGRHLQRRPGSAQAAQDRRVRPLARRGRGHSGGGGRLARGRPGHLGRHRRRGLALDRRAPRHVARRRHRGRREYAHEADDARGPGVLARLRGQPRTAGHRRGGGPRVRALADRARRRRRDGAGGRGAGPVRRGGRRRRAAGDRGRRPHLRQPPPVPGRHPRAANGRRSHPGVVRHTPRI
ncbi:MAG: hypothetical protein AVDCRST_MAG89-1909, partial [uncultured Gemmatimonadetes bacterium]